MHPQNRGPTRCLGKNEGEPPTDYFRGNLQRGWGGKGQHRRGRTKTSQAPKKTRGKNQGEPKASGPLDLGGGAPVRTNKLQSGNGGSYLQGSMQRGESSLVTAGPVKSRAEKKKGVEMKIDILLTGARRGKSLWGMQNSWQISLGTVARRKLEARVDGFKHETGNWGESRREQNDKD